MLEYGCTRLEIGVQSVYEDVARDTNRSVCCAALSSIFIVFLLVFVCLYSSGHTVRAVCESFQGSKDAGFKVVAHMMPDLPNVGLERDVEQFIEFFENPVMMERYFVLCLFFFFQMILCSSQAFRPDGLKLYPTLVIRGTGLYELWKTGRYKSYPPSVLVDLIARILALVPPWTRIYRIQR